MFSSFDFLAFKSLTSLTLQKLDVSPLKVQLQNLIYTKGCLSILLLIISLSSDFLIGPASFHTDQPESKSLRTFLHFSTAPL